MVRFWKGMGSFPSDLRNSNGPTANINARSRKTTVINRLSVLLKSGTVIAFQSTNPNKPSATSRQSRFKSIASFFIRLPLGLMARAIVISMFGLSSGLGLVGHLLVTAAFALPHWKDGIGIASTLIYSTIRRNNLPAAARTATTSRSEERRVGKE